MAASHASSRPLTSTTTGEEDTYVHFACQRCLQPLRIDPGFYSLNEHQYAELTLPIAPCPDFDVDAVLKEAADESPEGQEARVDVVVPPFKLNDSAFALVDENGEPATLR